MKLMLNNNEAKQLDMCFSWYRYYNPDLGRYITSDPLGLAAGMNTYIYVNGNPVNYTDPMGLYSAEDFYDYSVGFGDGEMSGKYSHLRNRYSYYLGTTPHSQSYYAGFDAGDIFGGVLAAELGGELVKAYSVPDELYHFTSKEIADNIDEYCLQPSSKHPEGIYATKYNSRIMAKLQGAANTNGKIIIRDTSGYKSAGFFAPGTFVKRTPLN